MARFAPPTNVSFSTPPGWWSDAGHTHSPDECGQLRVDLALCIARLVDNGVTDTRDLLRRSILHFLH